ncbi:MAG: site-specific integrase [Clostridiales bacterium]|jgi:integrase|nr:site-specific integrase [Clostridiales bacterium]
MDKARLLNGTCCDKTQKDLSPKNDVKESKNVKEEGKNKLFGDFARHWLETYKKRRAPNTKTSYKTMLNRHIIPYFGYMNICEIEEMDIITFSNLLDHIPATQRTCLQLLRQIFNSAINNRITDFNPCTSYAVQAHSYVSPDVQPFSRDEINQLMNAEYPSIKHHAFVNVLLWTGMRKGEILGLRFSDIDYKQKLIHVLRQSNRGHENKTKTAASLRDIPIGERLIHILRSYQSDKGFSDWVFPNTLGNLMGDNSFDHFYKPIQQMFNFPVNPHRFRHTYATRGYYSGVDIRSLQYVIGHATPAMLQKFYITTDKAESIKRIRNILPNFYK